MRGAGGGEDTLGVEWTFNSNYVPIVIDLNSCSPVSVTEKNGIPSGELGV